jgi:hypothetical protein
MKEANNQYQVFQEVITIGSGVAYKSGGIQVTATKARSVYGVLGVPADMTAGITNTYRWTPAAGATGFGPGGQGGQTIQVKAWFDGAGSSGAGDPEATSTNMSGRQLAVSYLGA